MIEQEEHRSGSDRKDQLLSSMEECRSDTLQLLELVPEEFLKRRVHSFYSPIGWHFGHVGRTEEFWVMSEALHRPLLDDRLTFLFADLPDNPKDNRVHIPDRDGIIDYLARTRVRVIDALARTNLETPNPLTRDGYAWEFALQHEYQHQETILEMLQLIQKELADSASDLPTWQAGSDGGWVEISGGAFEIGSSNSHYYDNEKDPHRVSLPRFRLAVNPVTAFEWTTFIGDGGYTRPELWSEAGWAWRERETIAHPEYWVRADEGWSIYSPYGTRSIDPNEPAGSLSWFEADAFARWAGKRLPSEAEWEVARKLGGDVHSPASISRTRGYPLPMTDVAADAVGLRGMAGSLWQWTASPFLPYPGFVPYPYDGYSWDHMEGEHFVCRGGSWATAKPIRRPSFRNWYLPTYRQGFLGMRLAESM